MGPCDREKGMYSPKIGLFMYSLALQLVIGYSMLLCSPKKLNITALIQVRNLEHIKAAGLDFIQICGFLHLILAIICFALLILVHAVIGCFKIPMLILTALQTGYCSVTASICVLYLQKGYFSITKVIELVKSSGFVSESPIFDNIFVENRNMLFFIGLLSCITASLFHKAQVVKGNDSIPQIMVVIPCLSLGIGVSFCLTAPCRDYRTFTLGFLWLLVCSAGDVISSFTRFCCFKPLKIVMLAIYVAVIALSVITIAFLTTLYTKGNIDYSAYLDIVHGKVMEFGQNQGQIENYNLIEGYFRKLTTSYTDEQLNVYMGNGNFILVAILLSSVCLMFGIFSLVYSVITFLDFKRKSNIRDSEIKVVVS